MTADAVFNIARRFDAPRDVLWQAWTDPKLFAQWFAPQGFTCHVETFELRPGGKFHYHLDGMGMVMWGKGIYRQIAAPTKLSWVHGFSDARGEDFTRHPFAPHWPLEMLSTMTLEAAGDQTDLTFTWVPINATDAEQKAFRDGTGEMNQGWGGTFAQLDTFLAKR